MGFFCLRCGMTPAEFWEVTPFECNALATAYIDKRKDDHRSRSWFTAQQMFASGFLPKGTSLRKVIEKLNAPIDKTTPMMDITSPEQMQAWEAEHTRLQQAKGKSDG